MSAMESKVVVAAYLKDSVPDLLKQTDDVTNGIEGEPSLFPNSASVVQGLKDARKNLADATKDSANDKSAARTRSAPERVLRNRLADAARYVETCANNDRANAEAIIKASTFSRKPARRPGKKPLDLKYGGTAGAVLCDAKAPKKGGRAFFSWRYSLDNGQTWVETAQTNGSKNLLNGLPVGKTVFVQVAITQKNVRSAWSDSATFLVR